jgi:hypothetical protein
MERQLSLFQEGVRRGDLDALCEDVLVLTRREERDLWLRLADASAVPNPYPPPGPNVIDLSAWIDRQ